MKKFLKLYTIEQKLGLRSGDIILFGIAMPVGIMALIAMIAGGKQAGSTDYTYMDSAFASLVAVGICACAFMGLPLTIADYRDKKILKHFFVTPCSPKMLLGANVLCSIMTSVISAIAVTVVAVLAFGYRMKGNPFLFIGAWALTLVSMLSIGMMIAALCKTVKSSNAVTSLVYFPMLFLSGATIPFELFPAGLQKVASVLPLSQGIKLMKETSMGAASGDVMGTIVLLAVITVVCGAISIKAFRWE